MSRHLVFYTDGAYSSKSQMGGWCSICLEDEQIIAERKGYEPYSTGNRCELLAMQSALMDVETIETRNTEVIIHTDSAYVANAFNEKWYANWMSNGWKTADKQPVKNQDLWLPIIAMYIKVKEKYNLQIIWIKGHNQNKWNDYVDLMAKKQRLLLEEKLKGEKEID